MPWFVMRDLSRRTSNVLAIHHLAKHGVEYFTPMTQMVMTIGGRRQRRDVPVIQDLLFVHEIKAALDPIVELYPRLQYRYQRGKPVDSPMSVRDEDMLRFIHAVTQTDSPRYYRPGELTSAMVGKDVRIIGGPLDGYRGRLLSVRGARRRRLLVDLPGILTAAVEVDPDFIQFL